jgi:hypothetical protein
MFRNKDKSMSESCLYWGLDCGDGWNALLHHLCAALSNTYSTGVKIGEEYMDVPAPQVIVDQVKSKFATLRFYYHLEFTPAISALYGTNGAARKVMDAYQSYYDGIIHMAESISARTCEETGLPGELHVSGGGMYGWYKTLNREFAKTDADHVKRGYIAASDVPEDVPAKEATAL